MVIITDWNYFTKFTQIRQFYVSTQKASHFHKSMKAILDFCCWTEHEKVKVRSEKHWVNSSDESNTIILNIEWIWASCFEHQMDLNMFCKRILNTNLELHFSRFTELLDEQIRTSFFEHQTDSNLFNWVGPITEIQGESNQKIFSKGYNSETKHFWPHFDKAKMRLRGSSFFSKL